MMKKQDVDEAVYQAVFWAVNLGVGRVVGQLRDVYWAMRSTVVYGTVDGAVNVAVHYEKSPLPGLELYLGGVG